MKVLLYVEYDIFAILAFAWIRDANDDEVALASHPQVFSALTRRVQVLIRQLGSIDCVSLAGCGDVSARAQVAIAKNAMECRYFCGTQ